MRKPTLIRATGLCLATAGLWLGLTQPQQPPDLEVVKVADDLHVLVGSGGNVAVYTTEEGVILVDDKFDQNVPQIVAKVAAITDKPIRYVLNTHQHGDHTGGNARLLTQGAEIISHDNARINMEKGKQPGLPRITFTETMSVNLGGKQVRGYHFGRGHTNGDAFLHFPARRVVHTGDMFVSGTPFIDYSASGSGVAWPKTLEAVIRLDFDTVIPGHGPVMKKEDLVRWKTSFENVQSRISDLRRQGRSKEEAAKLLKMDDLPGWGNPSRFWSERSFPGLWDELAR